MLNFKINLISSKKSSFKTGLLNLNRTKLISNNSRYIFNQSAYSETRFSLVNNNNYIERVDIGTSKVYRTDRLNLANSNNNKTLNLRIEAIKNSYYSSKSKSLLSSWPDYFVDSSRSLDIIPILEKSKFFSSMIVLNNQNLRIRSKLIKFTQGTLNSPVLTHGSIKRNFKLVFSDKNRFRRNSDRFSNHIRNKMYTRSSTPSNGYPISTLVKKLITQPRYNYMLKTSKYERYLLNEVGGRHPTSKFNSLRGYFIYTTNSIAFENWKVNKRSKNYLLEFYAMSWHYFKLNIEKFFFKQAGIRVHVWFLNIWSIFLTGMESYWQWFKFEDTKIYKLTRRGQRYLIEKREDAKFYIRSMVLALTLVGGVKLFLEKISGLVRNYRNNWAFITYSIESLRLCSNFFWFRFFLNYKVTFQGKIGGILRAEKKIFKKGNISIEDRQSSVAYHRSYPKTKFGIYNLSLWLQYKVPNLIGSFEELELVDTMKILLRMYTVPWLSDRLAHMIKSILIENDIKTKIKLAQLSRRKQSRYVLNAEVLKFKKKKNAKKRSN